MKPDTGTDTMISNAQATTLLIFPEKAHAEVLQRWPKQWAAHATDLVAALRQEAAAEGKAVRGWVKNHLQEAENLDRAKQLVALFHASAVGNSAKKTE